MTWRTGIVLSTLTLVPTMALAAQDVSGPPEPAVVPRTEFERLDWLEGRWVGSGGGYEAFYEAFRRLEDGALEQTTWPDSTFTEPDSRSTIEFRDGHISKYRGGELQTVVTRLDGDTVRFEWASGGRPGFSWIRISDDEWRAVLDRPGGREPVVYTLRRLEGETPRLR